MVRVIGEIKVSKVKIKFETKKRLILVTTLNVSRDLIRIFLVRISLFRICLVVLRNCRCSR